MAFTLVSSAGNVVEPTVLDLYGSGIIRRNGMVDLALTSGVAVTPSLTTSTGTMVFGISQDYCDGASDSMVRVTQILPDQIWAADCANTPVTAHIGVRHIMSAVAIDRGLVIYNTATDIATNTGIFLGLAIDTTTGTGKLLGRFMTKLGAYSGGL